MDRWLPEIVNHHLNDTLPADDKISYSCDGTGRDSTDYKRYELVFTCKITDNNEEFEGPTGLLDTMICTDDIGKIKFSY